MKEYMILDREILTKQIQNEDHDKGAALYQFGLLKPR